MEESEGQALKEVFEGQVPNEVGEGQIRKEVSEGQVRKEVSKVNENCLKPPHSLGQANYRINKYSGGLLPTQRLSGLELKYLQF